MMLDYTPFFLRLSFIDRPNPQCPDSQKKEDYHVRTARYFLSSADMDKWALSYAGYIASREFRDGNQWRKANIEAFLNDSSGKGRNRVAVTQNVVIPVWKQLVGGIIGASVNAKAQAMTRMATTRRERELGRLKMMTAAALSSPQLGQVIQEEYPMIGSSQEDTLSSFENYYQDCTVKATDALMQVVSSDPDNNFDVMKIDHADDCALGGWCVSHATPHQDKFFWERIHPLESLWDTNSKRNDLSDSQWWGVRPLLDMSTIVARWNPDPERVRSIMNYTRSTMQNTQFTKQTQIYVHQVYWKDWSHRKRAWVLGPDGEKELVIVDDSEQGPYTSKDAVDPPDNELNHQTFKGRKVRNEAIEIIRYCVFVPQEYLPGANVGPRGIDWVLAYGEYPLQEREWFDTAVVRSPVKISAFINSSGRFISPVQAAISPQELLNQTLTTFSGLLNQTGGSGMILDRAGLDPAFPENKVHMAAKNGETIIMNGRGNINNMLTHYDHTPKEGMYRMLQIVNYMNAISKESTSSTDVMRGQPTGGEQLVGVTENQQMRGMVMEMPFRHTIMLLYQQMYQYTAQAGRQFYAKNPSKLEQIVGMDDMLAVLMTPDALLEQFRVEVVLTGNQNARIEQGNMQILQFLQLQMLDPMTAAQLWGRSTPEDVAEGLRKSQKIQQEAAKEKQKQDAQAAQMAMAMQKQQEIDAMNQETYKDALDTANERMKEQAKGMQPYQRAEAASMFPPPDANGGQPPSRAGRIQPMTAQPGLR